MIKAVIFDLSGVIITRFGEIGKILEPVLKIDSPEIHRILKEKEFSLFLKGKITEEEYWKKIILKTKWKTDLETLKKAGRQNFRKIEGTLELVIKIKNRGFRLGLLSSHTKEWVKFLHAKFSYEHYFDSTVYSFLEGHTKPDLKLYYKIITKLKVQPADCVYIDDKEKYLKPATSIGMQTILFNSAPDLEKKLAALGIL